jgi:hypothetical protein
MFSKLQNVGTCSNLNVWVRRLFAVAMRLRIGTQLPELLFRIRSVWIDLQDHSEVDNGFVSLAGLLICSTAYRIMKGFSWFELDRLCKVGDGTINVARLLEGHSATPIIIMDTFGSEFDRLRLIRDGAINIALLLVNPGTEQMVFKGIGLEIDRDGNNVDGRIEHPCGPGPGICKPRRCAD